jgi:hypothetical protein
MTSLERYKYQ